MTGPNPDADLDEVLGVAALPPAAITDAHRTIAADLVEEWETDGTAGYENLEHRVAQAVADGEQRGAARVLTEHAIAGAPILDDELTGVPGAEAPRLELANTRRLLQKHGVAPADGLGVIRSTVAMVEEALIRRPPV